jgi:uncharacterized membrane protein
MLGLDLLLLGIVDTIGYALDWRLQSNQTGPAQTSQTPVEILKARYARGELAHEQYEQLRRGLQG